LPWRYFFIFLAVVLAIGAILIVPRIRLEQKTTAAEKEIQKRHLAAARERIDECLRRWPDEPRVHFLAARLARLQGEYHSAEKHLDFCRSAQYQEHDVTIENALLLAQQGKFQNIEQELQQLVTNGHPDRYWVLEAMATGYSKSFRSADALVSADMWLRDQPDFPPALFLKATLLEQLQRYEEATTLYQKCVDLDGDYDEARYRLASRYLTDPAFHSEETLVHFKRLHEGRPGNFDYALGYAQALANAGRSDQSRQILDELLAGRPNQSSVLVARGQLELNDGRPQEALPWLQKAHAIDRDVYQTSFLLARCLRQLGKDAEAAHMEKDAAQLLADSQRLHELTTKLLPRESNNPEYYYEAGTIQLRQGNVAEALNWFQGALRCDAKHVPTHRALAEYYEKNGNAFEARRHRELLTQK
jgi:tetratricopeptide (TPR) repeat protein